MITWQIAKDNGNQPIRNGGAKGFKKAIEALEEQGVMGIAGDCGFLMNYQHDARTLCTVPCFVSAILQVWRGTPASNGSGRLRSRPPLVADRLHGVPRWCSARCS